MKFSLPFLNVPDTALTARTQDAVPIADIVDDIIVYKDGGASIVLESNSLNFGLLSEKEQEAVILAYAALMNSLSFGVQIHIRSQKKNISSYLKHLDKSIAKTPSPKLKGLAESYRKFITDSIKKKKVLGKRFFMIIHFSPLELGVTKTIASTVKKSGALPFSKDHVVKKAKLTLYPRRDHLIRQAGRLGLKPKQLTTDQLIQLSYDIFNPELTTGETVTAQNNDKT